MGILEYIGFVIGASVGLIGLIASVIEISNFLFARKLAAATNAQLPLPIRSAIRYRELLKAVELAKRVLDEIRFPPDLIVGIHYNGLSFAALLAKQLYKPIHHASVHYSTKDGQHKCDGVILSVTRREAQGKRILVVDNSMESGLTLKTVAEMLKSYGADLKTLIFYQHRTDPNQQWKPDLVLFSSRERLQHFVQ